MPKKIPNLIGSQIGRLTVLEYCKEDGHSKWKCVCSCGTECTVKHEHLNRKSVKSCGCLRRDLAQSQLIGQKFGKLTVVSKDGERAHPNSKDRAVYWNCICECGNSIVARTNLLNNGHVKSCGCLKHDRSDQIIDLIGKKFGEIEVLHFHEKKGRRLFWMCRCSCGIEKPIDGHHLRSGSQKSCGCRSRGWKHGIWKKGIKEYRDYIMSDPTRRLRHRVSCLVRNQLFKRCFAKTASITKFLPYTIKELKAHLESLWEPWMSWENYGGKANDSRQTWHIDHIIPHSAFPYTSMDDPLFQECWALSNLRPLEKKANMSKGNRLIVD